LEESSSAERFEGLLEVLAKDFKGIPLTTLDTLVKNISLAPSVRSGPKEKLDPNVKYYEVGLRDINAERVITLEHCKKKNLGPANPYLVQKYALHENDLLLPYRASTDLTIARVGSHYPAAVVTNASVIRIEMKEDTTTELAILIQAYLSISYVKKAILPKEIFSRERRYGRYLISIKTLCALPIPTFTNVMVKDKEFGALYQRRLHLNYMLRVIRGKSMQLLQSFDKDEIETIKLYLHDKNDLPAINEKETYLLKKLDALLNEFVSLQNELL